MGKKCEEEEMFVLTPWGCLSSVLDDYGIDTSHIKDKVRNHIVEDFMDTMVNAGYVSKIGDTEEEKSKAER